MRYTLLAIILLVVAMLLPTSRWSVRLLRLLVVAVAGGWLFLVISHLAK